MKWEFNSIKFEISVLYTLILGVILIIFSLILSFMSNTFFRSLDSELKQKAEQVEAAVTSYLDVLDGNPRSLSMAMEKTISMKPDGAFQLRTRKISQGWANQAKVLNLERDYISFSTPAGTPVVRSPNISLPLQAVFLEDLQASRGRIVFHTIHYAKKSIRIIDYPIKIRGVSYILQVATAQDPVMRLMLNWLYSIAISVPLILLLTSFVGRILASRILEPMQEITTTARNISHHDLSARIKPKDFDVEMQELVGAFNDMISRLEQSFKHIEEFSYHVAHELKTPLTIIRGEAELILRKDRTVAEYKQAFQISLEESERMLKTIDDLLLLTKLDYQPEAFKFEEFEFIQFLQEVCTQAKVLCLKKNIHFDFEMPDKKAMMNGTPLHLRRLFFNIIDNAVKFTPEGGEIHLKAFCHPQQVEINITDSGGGITPEALPKIFSRFYSMDSGGNGLGLNIAQTIAKLHQGTITVESAPGQGATFKIMLPHL